MQRVVEEDPVEGLDALIHVLRTLADVEDGLGSLGADAREDLFRLHADVFLGRLHQNVAEDEPLRVAARTMWLPAMSRSAGCER
jgi:hypothetical protein